MKVFTFIMVTFLVAVCSAQDRVWPEKLSQLYSSFNEMPFEERRPTEEMNIKEFSLQRVDHYSSGVVEASYCIQVPSNMCSDMDDICIGLHEKAGEMVHAGYFALYGCQVEERY